MRTGWVEWWYECENTGAFPLVRKGDPKQVIRGYEDCDFKGYVWAEPRQDTLVIVCPSCDYETHLDYETVFDYDANQEER